MNEFEWRRQMRDLRRPAAPSPELWARIDAALDHQTAAAVPPPAAPAMTARRRQRWLLAASCAALAVIVGGLTLRLESTRVQDGADTPRVALDEHWKPGDPRLSGAAVELDAAQAELQQALHQAPASAALQRLLARTEQQQSRLRRLDHEAG